MHSKELLQEVANSPPAWLGGPSGLIVNAGPMAERKHSKFSLPRSGCTNLMASIQIAVALQQTHLNVDAGTLNFRMTMMLCSLTQLDGAHEGSRPGRGAVGGALTG